MALTPSRVLNSARPRIEICASPYRTRRGKRTLHIGVCAQAYRTLRQVLLKLLRNKYNSNTPRIRLCASRLARVGDEPRRTPQLERCNRIGPARKPGMHPGVSNSARAYAPVQGLSALGREPAYRTLRSPCRRFQGSDGGTQSSIHPSQRAWASGRPTSRPDESFG